MGILNVDSFGYPLVNSPSNGKSQVSQLFLSISPVIFQNKYWLTIISLNFTLGPRAPLRIRAIVGPTVVKAERSWLIHQQFRGHPDVFQLQRAGHKQLMSCLPGWSCTLSSDYQPSSLYGLIDPLYPSFHLGYPALTQSLSIMLDYGWWSPWLTTMNSIWSVIHQY